jgi:uncharacterized OsmC-like protein
LNTVRWTEKIKAVRAKSAEEKPCQFARISTRLPVYATLAKHTRKDTKKMSIACPVVTGNNAATIINRAIAIRSQSSCVPTLMYNRKGD